MFGKKTVRSLLVSALMFAAASGLLPGAGDSTASASRANDPVAKVIQAGMKYLGTPYEFGSSRSNTRTFDCSDFVRQSFIEGANLRLPTNSRTQAEYVKRKGDVKRSLQELERGDIVFFISYQGNSRADYAGINKSKARITHNGIYLGNGRILHTYSNESGGVRTDNIRGTHWEYRFVFGGSPL